MTGSGLPSSLFLKVSDLDPNKPFDLLYKLSLENQQLKHHRDKRKRFIERHQEVRQAFFDALQKQNKTSQHDIMSIEQLTGTFEDS